MTKKNAFFKLDPYPDPENNFLMKILGAQEEVSPQERKALTPPFYPKTLSPQREKEWVSARRCLKEGLRELGVEAPLETLEIVNFLFLKHYPQFLVSLSHTKNLGAGILAPRNLYRSVGIDIEPSSRKISPKACTLIKNPQDCPQMPPLKLWILKEAAFKALSPITPLSPLAPHKLWPGSLWIKDGRFGMEGDPHPRGHVGWRSTFFQGEAYDIGYAFIPFP